MTHISMDNQPTNITTQPKPPLCVDMDGTLIHSDLLIESALALLAHRPLMFFAMLLWLLKGKAHLKREIAARVELDASTLPYNLTLVNWLRTERASGRHVVLCTASDAALANQVAAHAGVFDEVLASDGHRNLAGSHKAQTLVERYGEKGFDYAGNARVDLAVWKHAHAAIVVAPGNGLVRTAARVTTVDRHIEPPRGGLKAWLKALRVHQWIKNVLIFLPLLAAHRVTDLPATGAVILAFLCFGLCASSVYLTNDLLDLPADRLHHRKRHRPFAAGSLPLVAGPIAALLLLVVAFVLAWSTSPAFAGVLLGYYILTTAYSFKLKRIMMLDVVVLAMLYTSRILAGAAAIRGVPSFWLLAFSMFIFLSLAMVKRYVELLTMQRAGKVKASGRGYDVEDIPLLQSLGGSSGYLAVLVLALYIDSTASSALYRHPHYLWLLCPLLLYWISRTWAIAHRGLMHDDPVVFAVMDNTSRVLLVLAGIVIVSAL
jgi:4-hydroxybenzoate polyprenyltransferase